MTFSFKDNSKITYLQEATHLKERGKFIYKKAKTKLARSMSKNASKLPDLVDLYECFRAHSFNILMRIRNKIFLIKDIEAARLTWLENLLTIEKYLSSLKDEISTDGRWPAKPSMKNWNLKGSGLKLVNKIPDIIKSSNQYRRLLVSNGLLNWLEGVINREQQLLQNLPQQCKCDFVYKLKDALDKYIA